MADDILSGLLGGEQDAAAESAEGKARGGAEGFAAALAADHAKYDPAVAAAAADFLKAQTEAVLAERPVRIADGKLRRTSQRLRIGMQLFGVLVATVFGGVLLVMVVDAFRSQSVIVDPFDAPAALAGRGLTGKMVATGLLDELTRLQAATHANGGKRTLANAWSGEIKVEVPQTGLSVSDFDRMLKSRFGHDLHIGGELVQAEAGGLALTVRGESVPAKTFTGASGDLDKLTTAAAEYVYGRAQPAQFGFYLLGKGRSQDALEFLPGAFARATTDAERADLANSWGNTLGNVGRPAQAIEKYRLTMSLAPPRSPTWWKAWGNLLGSLTYAQGEEAGWREARAYLDARARIPKGERPDVAMAGNAAQITWDLPLLLAGSLADAARNSGAGSKIQPNAPSIADTYGLMHDAAQVQRYLAASDPDDATTKVEALLLQAYTALDRGDGAAATAPMEAFWMKWKAAPALQYAFADNQCLLGRAYGLAGRTADAEALFEQAGAWSRCYAYHGEALERAGDLPGAERVWARGLALAPDLSYVYIFRGISEMNRGQYKAAEADLAIAHTKAPHYADPLKAWGDLKTREGRWKEALAKYDEALKYAPAWSELRQARAAAAGKV